MPKILLIDDDQRLADLLEAYFSRFNLELISAVTAEKGLKIFASAEVELVILDVMLPGKNGFDVCKEIRMKSNIPIIMLTARGEVTDRIVGLEIGADDYMPKPFEPRELVARIHNILRRSVLSPTEPKILSFKDLIIDRMLQSVEVDGKQLDLTTMEYQLLHLLSSHPGRTFNRDEILNDLRGIDAQLFSRSVDILVSRLRQKLGDTSKHARFIKTVWGKGYVFVSKESDINE
ncbi:MAG: response regulator transcription factor [Pseudomonadota bacterium]|nr:response regulator transcription factor [Pseudomonadota bacterium]